MTISFRTTSDCWTPESSSRSPRQELVDYKASLDTAAMAIEIDQIQQRLVRLAAAKTRKLQCEIEAADTPPDPAGIKI